MDIERAVLSAEHDNQIYKRMQECLLGFRAHTMNLGALVDELPQLVKELREPNAVWKSEFVSYWWTLEQIHGEAIEMGESGRMPADARKTVDESIEGLDRLVNGALVSH